LTAASDAGGAAVIRPIDQELGSLSIPISAQEIGSAGRELSFSADEGERADLAERFGLQKVLELKVQGKLTKRGNGDVLFRGDLKAKVVQTCVVTLDPVENMLDEPVRLRFVSEERIAETAREVVVDPGEEEEIEPVAGEVMDLGPAVAEQFGVALDPYPRKPGAELPGVVSIPDSQASGVASGTRRPFEVLKNLRSRG
jgi:uncharacterized metal-binding protein YceD (DUF177 family)